MLPAQARLILTESAIRETATVLTAIDVLAAEEYQKRTKKGKKLPPHSESQILDVTNKAFENFMTVYPAGCSNGSHLAISFFINGLGYIHEKKKREVAIAINQELIG